jgi:hypothetical protein
MYIIIDALQTKKSLGFSEVVKIDDNCVIVRFMDYADIL